MSTVHVIVFVVLVVGWYAAMLALVGRRRR
jgi:hypothetical protein